MPAPRTLRIRWPTALEREELDPARENASWRCCGRPASRGLRYRCPARRPGLVGTAGPLYRLGARRQRAIEERADPAAGQSKIVTRTWPPVSPAMSNRMVGCPGPGSGSCAAAWPPPGPGHGDAARPGRSPPPVKTLRARIRTWRPPQPSCRLHPVSVSAQDREAGAGGVGELAPIQAVALRRAPRHRPARQLDVTGGCPGREACRRRERRSPAVVVRAEALENAETFGISSSVRRTK